MTDEFLALQRFLTQATAIAGATIEPEKVSEIFGTDPKKVLLDNMARMKQLADASIAEIKKMTPEQAEHAVRIINGQPTEPETRDDRRRQLQAMIERQAKAREERRRLAVQLQEAVISNIMGGLECQNNTPTDVVVPSA